MTILIHPSGHEFEFEDAHAERIMAMENNGGWKRKEIKSDAGAKGNKRTAKKPKAKGKDQQSQ